MLKRFGAITLAVLGAIILAALVWFAGPMFAFGDWRPLETANARLVTIGVLLLLWFGRRLLVFIRHRLFNRRLLEALAPTPRAGPEPEPEHLRIVRERFDKAVGIMRDASPSARQGSRWSRIFRREPFVYQLPWYVFIGPPGSGKTTALLNAGLNFPLADRIGDQPVRGIAGTRHCDWWFTDRAVLIDTAGRYVTQDSHAESDAAEWRAFIGLLRRFRPRQPINGALVTISMADLLQSSPAGRHAQASAIRARLQELATTLDTRFPVYLLITKADLLPGFMECFGEMSRDAREQVWGTTFPFDEERPGAPPQSSWEAAYDQLVERLARSIPLRLQRERDPRRRALIHGFAHQLATVRTALLEIVGQALSGGPLANQIHVRGFYLTSGTQEGTPVDRVMGTLGRSLGLQQQLLPPSKASGKAFFLHRLLAGVIIPESPIAGTNLAHERRMRRLRWAGALGGVALAVLALGAWTASYRENRAYVATVGQRATELAAQMKQSGPPSDIRQLLPLYRTLARFAVTDDVDPQAPRWLQGLGLFQGRKLDEAAQQSYHRVLRQTLAPALANRLAWVLRQGQATPELQYETLKVALMLASPDRMRPDAVLGWIASDLAANRATTMSEAEREALIGHVRALLERQGLQQSLVIDPQVLAQTRARLAETPFPQRVYRRLLRLDVGRDLPPFRPDHAGGPSAALVFARRSGRPLSEGIPGLFTYEGYYKRFHAAAADAVRDLAEEEVWVLGIADSANARRAAQTDTRESLADEVRRLYLLDYAARWEQFVGDLTVVQSGSLTHAIQSARILSDADSPLPRLLRAIVREVTLTEAPGRPASSASLVDRAAEELRQKVDALRGGGVAASAPPPQLESIVDDRFQTLRRFVRGEAPGAPAPVDTSVKLVAEIYQQMIATESAMKSGVAPPRSDLSDRLRADSARMPEPVRGMLRELAAASAGQVAGATRLTIEQELAGTLAPQCRAAIDNRYPFHAGSAADVTAEDFARVFGPGGLMDEFFQRRLAAHVDTNVRPWRFRQTGEGSIGGGASLIQFQRAAEIRRAFFQGGAAGPSVRFQMKPLRMDPSLLHFNLDADGQVLQYAHGPAIPQTLQWPGTRGTNQIRIQASTGVAGAEAGLLFEGPWAALRMFDRAQVIPGSRPEQFRAVFRIDSRPIEFEVTTSSVQNPLRLDALRSFRCPGRL